VRRWPAWWARPPGGPDAHEPMIRLPRRLRVFWARSVSPGVLEQDPRFRVLLRALTRQGLQVVGLVTAAGAVLHVLYRVAAGDAVTWVEDAEVAAGSVQLWDKVLLAGLGLGLAALGRVQTGLRVGRLADRKSTRLNSSHVKISYAVFCLKKKKEQAWTGQLT